MIILVAVIKNSFAVSLLDGGISSNRNSTIVVALWWCLRKQLNSGVRWWFPAIRPHVEIARRRPGACYNLTA